MKTVDPSEIPQLLAQKIPPIIFRETPACNSFLNDFAQLAADVEERKKRAQKQDKPA